MDFHNQYFLSIRTTKDEFLYSSFSNFNFNQEAELLNPTIKILKTDNNNDSKNDKFNIRIETDIIDKITEVKVLLIFDYGFDSSAVQYSTKSMMFLQKSSNLGISEIKFVGALQMKQKSAIDQQNTSKINESKLKNDLFNGNKTDIDVMSIYQHFKYQDITLDFDGAVISSPSKYPNKSVVDIELIIPSSQEVMYIAKTVNALKSTWVQYFCTFLPVVFAFYHLLKFAFETKILKSMKSVEKDLRKNTIK